MSIFGGRETAFELFMPSEEENKLLHSLDKTYIKFSEMSNEEREFLSAIILRNRSRKLLEIGVSAGASSVIMLNAIRNNPEAKLFSIDYLKNWYRDKKKNSGFIVDNYPDLKNKWKLFTGSLSFNFLEEIGGNIDLCLIDTVHSNPGELLDTLMVFPFLNDGAIIVFHDVNCHTFSGNFAECNPLGQYTNNLLFSIISGKKYVQGNFIKGSPFSTIDKTPYFPNIGAIKINDETRKHIFEIFNLLTLKWTYLLTIEEEKDILNFFSKYYENYFIEYMEKIFAYQRDCFEYTNTNILWKIIKAFIPYGLLKLLRKIKWKFI